MKKLIVLLGVASITLMSFGQKETNTTLDKSKMQWNIGVGLSTWGLPVFLGVDYWLKDDITVGVEGSFRYSLWSNYATIGASVNANFHFAKYLDLPDNIDLYGGLSAGPYFSNYWTHKIRININGQIGGRYHLSETTAVMAELGGGTFSGGKVGLTFRF